MAKQKFGGTGMKFPPQINQATGRFVTVSEEENIKESIYLILMTQKMERFMRPDYGSRIMSYAFADTNMTMLNIMRREIIRDILKNEPRVEDVAVRIDAQSQAGCLMIYIDYVVQTNHARDSLVFPFYMSTEPEEEGETYEAMEEYEIE